MNADVLIVGAGPAGLAAAIELRKLGVKRVLVADRERDAGGVPRHCAHTGYGIRDLHRVLTGPAYARQYVAKARDAGAEVLAGATVTALDDGAQAALTSQEGIRSVSAGAVLLATGCRERPRTARLVPGDRPAGVMTTSELQQRVYLAGQRLGGRAMVIGAEHVSFSAMLTLMHAGARVVALVTDRPSHQSYGVFRAAAAVRWRVPVWTSAAVARIVGRERVAAVELRDLASGRVRLVECETVVFSGDWIPDYELCRLAGAQMDPGTKGPAVDTALRTSVPWLFAAGNLVHAGEPADLAALSGRHAARHIAAQLRCCPPHEAGTAPVPIRVKAPLAWIAPNAIGDGRVVPPRGHFMIHGEPASGRADLLVRQDARVLGRFRPLLPRGGSGRLPARWIRGVDPSGGPVTIAPASP
jgi:thioredoxin reductase